MTRKQTNPPGGAPWGCADVRERIPEHVAGRLEREAGAAVAAHLDGCDSCAGEAELVGLLYATRVESPRGLSARVEDALRRPARRPSRPWWGLSAAAVAAVALGIGISSEDGSVTGLDTRPAVSEFEEGELWLSDDGMLAGAPAIDALSDEVLQALLDELASETAQGGGA